VFGCGVRAAIVALSREALSFLPSTELINKEAEVIGVSDYLASELPSLVSRHWSLPQDHLS
jgi:hypothetical protein